HQPSEEWLCQNRIRRTRLYISPSPAEGGTPPPSRFLGSTMTHSMRSIFDSPFKLVFSGAIQPCNLASTSIARILSDALIFHGSNFALWNAHQFFGGPCEIRLDCLGEFFFHRL